MPPSEDVMAEQRKGNDVVVLRHPSGTQVYLVGTAHVSSKERYNRLLEAADSGDKYGLARVSSIGSWKIAKMALTGEVLTYGLGLVYSMTGAVMGTQPGGEFLAAHTAAQEDSKREDEVRRMRRMMQGRPEGPNTSDGGLTIDDRMPGEWPDMLRRPAPPTEKEKEVSAEVEAAGNPDDPWGLGSMDGTEQGSKRRLLELMREGGCDKPDQVLQAAMRMLKDGMTPKGQVSTQDLLTVRDCGNKVVENFRARAIKGDDTWIQRLELETVSGAKGTAGLERSAMAMKKVIVDERDLILARRLWESGLEAAGQPVVGVVGAGHIKGIQKYWTYAGTPAAEAKVTEFLRVPQEQEGSATLTAIGTGAVIAAIAYRRPKAAAFLVGAVSLATAPYLGFMVASMNRQGHSAGSVLVGRFKRFTTKLVDAANRADVSLEQGAPGGWGTEAPGEWQ
ncbi:hypothetical protein N2152v2_003833 [Parachlorella kessleri]